MKKPFCVRGHDISVIGRYDNGHCKECVRLHSLAYRKARGPEWVAAKERRHYLRMKQDPVKYAKKAASRLRWRQANPERDRQAVRASKKKHRGVNFWVAAASKSR